MVKSIPRDGVLELAPQQENWWYNEFLVGHIHPNNVHKTLRLTGAFRPIAFEQSVAVLQRRHEALRTAFVPRDSGGATVLITPPDACESPVTHIDLTRLAPDEQADALRSASQQELSRPFDLTRGNLFRVIIARLGVEDHVIIFTIHHLVYDRWSGDTLVAEAATLYASAVSGMPSQLRPLAFQYVDFAHWQRDWLSSPAAASQFSFWRHQLALPLPPLLPPLEDEQGLNAAPILVRGCVPFVIGSLATKSARSITRSEKCTLFSTMMAVLKTTLYAYSRQPDLRVGTPSTNRCLPDAEHVVGLFTNIVCLRTKIDPTRPFREFLRSVFATIIDAMDNQDLPYEIMARDLEITQQTPREALLHAVAHWMAMPSRVAPKFPSSMTEKTSRSDFDTRESVVFVRNNINFRFELTERESMITGKITYNLSRFSVQDIRDLANAMEQCIILAATDPGVTIAQLCQNIAGKSESVKEAAPSSTY